MPEEPTPLVEPAIPSSRQPYATQLGSVLRERRWDLGLSQAEVAAHAGITTAAVSAIEGGHVKLPAPERLRALADILGLRHVGLLVAAGLLTTDAVPGSAADAWNTSRYPHLHRANERMTPATAETLQDLLVLLAGEPALAADLAGVTRQSRRRNKGKLASPWDSIS